MSNSNNINNKKRKPLKKNNVKSSKNMVIVIFVLLGIIVIAGYYLVQRFKVYDSVSVEKISQQEDIASTKYLELGNKIVKYSTDEIDMLNEDLDTVWNDSYKMKNPTGSVYDQKGVIADIDGTTLVFFGKSGVTGTTKTPYKIIKAKASKRGFVTAILDGGEQTWINFYSYDGSLIAEHKTRVEAPGYPLDVAVSPKGNIMMVSYQYVKEDKTVSYVAFYNFGDVGQNQDDRLVSGYKYEDTVIPQVDFFQNGKALAISDKGLILYSESDIPKEEKEEKINKEIISATVDENTVGLVTKSLDKKNAYDALVYNSNIKNKYSKNFNISYNRIHINNGEMILFNSSELRIFNSTGNLKFKGMIDGNIINIYRIGGNKYFIVTDAGISIVKLT